MTACAPCTPGTGRTRRHAVSPGGCRLIVVPVSERPAILRRYLEQVPGRHGCCWLGGAGRRLQELEQVAGCGRVRQTCDHLVAECPHLWLSVPGVAGKAQFPGG